jgi:hypothetical protein
MVASTLHVKIEDMDIYIEICMIENHACGQHHMPGSGRFDST